MPIVVLSFTATHIPLLSDGIESENRTKVLEFRRRNHFFFSDARCISQITIDIHQTSLCLFLLTSLVTTHLQLLSRCQYSIRLINSPHLQVFPQNLSNYLLGLQRLPFYTVLFKTNLESIRTYSKARLELQNTVV